jgi:membrane associated rhomboid family serine protease
MFFLFPLGHEQMEARRWPLVTLAIIALCALLLGWTHVAAAEHDAQTAKLRSEAVRLIAENPDSQVPDELRELVPVQTLLTAVTPKQPDEAGEPAALAPAPAELIELGQRLQAQRASAPFQRFGLRRGNSWWTLLSAAFLHGGVLHFLSNAWFLWLSGATIEDRWGRRLFAGFYLLAAVVSGLTHRLLTSAPDVPLIGASGAVAATMGAFMVIHGAAKIRFAYVLMLSFRPKLGTFEARATIMLLLWVAAEAFWALLGVDDGTAHFAHVGGFAFGAAVAFGFRRSGLDQRLNAAIDAETTRWQDPRILEAAKLAEDRRHAEAFALLDQVARDIPHSIDAQLEMLRLAQAAGDKERERRAYAALLEGYLHQNMPDAALALLTEVRQLRLELERGARLRIAEALARSGQREPARLVYEGLLESGAIDETYVRAAVAFAVVTARTGRDVETRRHLEAARSSPHCGAELAQRVDAQLTALAAREEQRA